MNIIDIFTKVLQSAFFFIGIWAIILIMCFTKAQVKKIAQKEKEILAIQDEIIKHKQENKSKLEILIAKREKLKMERQFLLDRLPLLNFLKK